LTGRAVGQTGLVVVVVLLSSLVTIGELAPSRLTAAVHRQSPLPSAAPLPTTWDLDSDIGAVMVLSWKSTVEWSTVRSLLVKDQIGGVLLFTPNFGGSPAGTRAWSDRFQSLATATCQQHPTLVMLDEEGGAVANVKAPFAPPWPVEMASRGVAQVRELERVNGAGLRAAGVDLNLAPVADVRTNYRDAVIGGRSFGSSPGVVAPLVGAAVQGLHDGGVGATVKHWPGLGGAAGDPQPAAGAAAHGAALRRRRGAAARARRRGPRRRRRSKEDATRT